MDSDSDAFYSEIFAGRKFYWATKYGITSRSNFYNVYELNDTTNNCQISCQAIRVSGNKLVILLLNCEESCIEIEIMKRFWQSRRRKTISHFSHHWSPQSNRVYMDVSTDFMVTVDSHKRMLYCFNFDGKIILTAHLHSMQRPLGIHIDTDKNIIVSDNMGGSVTKFSMCFEYRNVQPIWSCEGISRPTGITSDDYGVIYVASNNGSLSYISPDGRFYSSGF